MCWLVLLKCNVKLSARLIAGHAKLFCFFVVLHLFSAVRRTGVWGSPWAIVPEIKVHGNRISRFIQSRIGCSGNSVYARMDESTFEMFEEELRTPAQQESAQKPIRHVRRSDTQSLKRTMENLPSPQPAPKVTQQEMSRGLSLRRALSIPSLSQIEAPWKNVTLNRCLILAITIVLIGSSFQRLYEVLQAWRHKDGPEVSDPHTLYLRHVSLKQEVSLQQAESSLWDNWFWDWILDEEDEDDEENLKGRSKMKGNQRGGGRGSVGQLKHKKATEKKVVRAQEGKASDKRERRKKDRHEKGESFREVAKGHRDREKVRGRGFEDKAEEAAKGKRRKAEGQKQVKRQQETAEIKRAGIRTHRHSM